MRKFILFKVAVLLKKVLIFLFIMNVLPIHIMPLYAFDKKSFIDSYSGIEFKALNNKTYLAVYEVTQEQWYKVMNTAPFSFNKGGSYPAETISIGDIQKFLNTLNEKTNSKYRLPTVAEWKEAAGEPGYSRDNICNYANVYDISSNSVNRFGNAYFDCDDGYPNTSPVGSFPANAKGFHDLYGNVKEWLCNSESDRTNTCAYLLGAASLAVAGGGYSDGPKEMKNIVKDERTSLRFAGLGFRLAIDKSAINVDAVRDKTAKDNIITPSSTIPVAPEDSNPQPAAIDNQKSNTTEKPSTQERKFKFLPFLRD